MEINFQTKEISNLKQREEFLKLSPEQRIRNFFRLVYYFNNFPTQNKLPKNSFEITKNG